MKLAVIWWIDNHLNHLFGRHVSIRFCRFADEMSGQHFIDEYRNPTPGHSCGHCQEWTEDEQDRIDS